MNAEIVGPLRLIVMLSDNFAEFMPKINFYFVRWIFFRNFAFRIALVA